MYTIVVRMYIFMYIYYIIMVCSERGLPVSCEMFRIRTHTHTHEVQPVSVEWMLFYSPIKERRGEKKRRGEENAQVTRPRQYFHIGMLIDWPIAIEPRYMGANRFPI